MGQRTYKIQNLSGCCSPYHPLWLWVLVYYKKQRTAPRDNEGENVALDQ